MQSPPSRTNQKKRRNELGDCYIRAIGLFTATVLFVPIAVWAYYGAWQDGVLKPSSGIVSGVLGFLMMMFPIVLQVTKRLPFFAQ